MHIQPKFFPVNGDLAAYWILAANELGGTRGARRWPAPSAARSGSRSATSPTPRRCGRSPPSADCPADLDKRAQAPEIAEKYAALTQEAIARGVFGAPTYVVADELFWGQDRLDFLDRKLAK